MLYCVLDDIALLRKLKLADISALDGAITNISLFRLGSLEHKIAQSAAAAAKLAEILSSHTGAGTMDLIWGADIDMIESKTQVHNFLGKTKYEPTIEAINGGLGIPQTLSGAAGSNGGTTNNFLSLKTLTERLQYGRDRLVEFWEKELIKLQRGLGLKTPPKLEFDLMTLADEAAMKALFIQ